jgi:hypothetical protein
MAIIGCSARQAVTPGPLPGLELYEGGCVPPLRTQLGGQPRLRPGVPILSAEHGLVTADTPLHTYDRPLDAGRSAELRPTAMAALRQEMITEEVPHEVLVLAEPPYLVPAEPLALPTRPRAQWIPDLADDWPQASAVRDHWGW